MAEAARASIGWRKLVLPHHHEFHLLDGLDDIGLTLRHADEITTYESTRPYWLPAVTA